MSERAAFVTPSPSFFGMARAGVAALGLLALAACAGPAGGPKPEASAGGGSTAPSTTQAPRVDPNAPVTVALIAPTTAGSDGVRRAAQDLVAAAQMAMSERAPANMVLKVYDSRGDAAGAAEAASHAVRDGAALVLGPLLASSAEAAAPVAAQAGLNVIAFSNDTSVAGGNLWVLGQTPDDEMRRIFAFAGSRGYDAVAVAHPDNRYGQQVASAAPAAARAAGVGVVTTASYPYAPQRGRGNFDAINESAHGVARQIIGSGADSVLLAEVGTDLQTLGSFINYYDVAPRRYRYLGLSRWNTRATLREPALKGGWFVSADPNLVTGFEQRFAARMSRRPSAVASVGYDAVVAAADMLEAGGGAFDAAAITRGQHRGATGPFRLTPDGGNARGLAILEVGENGFGVVDPAPAGAPGA